MKNISEMISLELAYQTECYLDENNINIDELSVKCGVSRNMIKKVISQEEVPIHVMEKICDVLSLSFDALKNPHDRKLCQIIETILNHMTDIVQGDYSLVNKEITMLPEKDILRSMAWLTYYCELSQAKSIPPTSDLKDKNFNKEAVKNEWKELKKKQDPDS